MYCYQPLSDPKSTIRLLTLLPGNLGSPMQCELHERNFPPQEAYTALSYEWGPPDHGFDISVNGQQFFIRKNLTAFLKRLRSDIQEGQTLTIWADAICIDQSSIPEKNSQVRMMGKIYSHSRNVISWLGENEQIERLFRSLELYTTSSSHDDFAKAASHRETGWNKLDRGARSFVVYKEFTTDLVTFNMAAYFQRAWIIQEMILAPSLSLLCGSSYLTHEGLIMLDRHIQYQSVTACHSRVSTIIRGYVDSKLTSIPESNYVNPNLYHVLSEFAYTRCFDRHDKIYAFIGIAWNIGDDFVVDYDKSIPQLVLETLAFEFRTRHRTKSLTTLQCCFNIIYTPYHAELASLTTYGERAAWASDFVTACQLTLPASLLNSKITLWLPLVGQVTHVDRKQATLAPRKPKDIDPPDWTTDMTCHIFDDAFVQEGDLVYCDASFCLIFRLCELDLSLISVGIVVGDNFPDLSPSDLEYKREVYADFDISDIDSTPAIDVKNNQHPHSTVGDRESTYSNAAEDEDWAVTLRLADFLVILKAEFPHSWTNSDRFIYSSSGS